MITNHICRAKSEVTGEWIRGYVYPSAQRSGASNIRWSIAHLDEEGAMYISTTVDNMTVCRSTTVCSCGANSDLIFEGDIVQHFNDEERQAPMIVKWTGDRFWLYSKDDKIVEDLLTYPENIWSDWVVTGNVFDNPELLKKCGGFEK